MNMKIQKENVAILIGHSKESPGARSYNGVSEYDFNKTVASFMKHLYDYEKLCKINSFDLFIVDRNQGWSGVRREYKKNFVGLSIELHFNSFKDEARGTECLALTESDKSIELAKHVANDISFEYKTKLRGDMGLKEINNGDRGYYNLDTVEDLLVDAAIIVEPTFANKPTYEAIALITNPMRYASTLYESIRAYTHV